MVMVRGVSVVGSKVLGVVTVFFSSFLLAGCSLGAVQERIVSFVDGLGISSDGTSGGLGGIVRDGSSVTREEVLERLDLRSGFLDLRGLGLKDIPDLCKLLQVDEAMAVLAVDLSSNSLERVDISLECMQFLQEVDLSFNTISEFVTLGNVPLQSLVLSKNALKDLGGVSNYSMLQRLDVGFNQLMSSSGVQQLSALRELSLHHNLLSDLEGIDQLLTLDKLSIEFNKFTDGSLLQNLKSRLNTAIRGIDMAGAGGSEEPIDLGSGYLYQADPNRPEFIGEE